MCLGAIIGGFAGKNMYNAGKTSALFSVYASGANMCFVVVKVMVKMAPIFTQSYNFEGLFMLSMVGVRSDQVSESNCW